MKPPFIEQSSYRQRATTWIGGALRLALLSPLFGLTACSLDSLVSHDPPPNIADPARVQTRDGAIQAYYGALSRFRTAFGGQGSSYIVASAALTDEIGSDTAWQGSIDLYDARILPEFEDPSLEPARTSTQTYNSLQQTRNAIREAISGLRTYAPDLPPALMGHLLALQGYTQVFLADLYCSGIPLSTLDFKGDFTLMPGSSTEAVYTHAVALFDSALALSADSVRIHSMATIGKARTLLALGKVSEAGTLAQTIPNGFLYRMQYSKTLGLANFAYSAPPILRPSVMISDRAGGVGYAYATEKDPRTPATVVLNQGRPEYYPAWHTASGDSAITLAGFVEARLIEAEASLDADRPDWLSIVNTLRTNGNFTTRPNATNPSQTDTLWAAGTGGIAGLRPLRDPGTAAARLDIIFKERAFWMMLTGHRQGDARRLVREYGRPQTTVYPSGPYPGGGRLYGTDVSAPIPALERQLNPKFTGCINREA